MPTSTLLRTAAGDGIPGLRGYSQPEVPGGLDALVARASAHAPGLPDGRFFSHSTAAAIHRMWLPESVVAERCVHVAACDGTWVSRRTGVEPHKLNPRPGLVDTVDGLPVSSAIEAWCQLADRLTSLELAVAAESLLTPGRTDPAGTLARLRQAAEDRTRRTRVVLAEAAASVRIGSRSRVATTVRLLIVSAGLPEPVADPTVELAADPRTAPGLAYPERRILLDLTGASRASGLAAPLEVGVADALLTAEWRVLRVTEGDLARPAALLARLRRILSGGRS